jgi:hypothetical protein
MTESTRFFTFKPTFARRIPDPVYKGIYGTESHIFLINVRDLPLDIGNDANARDSSKDMNREVYRDVEDSLLENQKGSPKSLFHHKNKGITILAQSVDQAGDNVYRVAIDPARDQGIVDGGHTYGLIAKHIKEGDLPENQFVFVFIRVGIPNDWHPYIAGGLNTGIQVPQANLADLSGYFGHLKSQLAPLGLADKIAWRVEDPGVPIRDVLSILLLFNIELYPTDQASYPIESYSSKAVVLKTFKDKAGSFERMPAQFIREILALHDYINTTAHEIWNDGTRKFGALEWAEYRDKRKPRYKPIDYPFTGVQSDYGIAPGALYPILGAFRWLVGYDKSKVNMGWRLPFEDVKAVWQTAGREMLNNTQDNIITLGRNQNALGKHRPQWGQMFNILKASKP